MQLDYVGVARPRRVLLDAEVVERLVPITTEWSGTLGRHTGVLIQHLPWEFGSDEDAERLRVMSMSMDGSTPLLQEILPASALMLGDGDKAVHRSVRQELLAKLERMAPCTKLTMRVHNTGKTPLIFNAVAHQW